VLSSGMVTGVGLNAAASCAAIRVGINLFDDTRFIDDGGEWIVGSSVPLEQPWRGRRKLIEMVSRAINECLDPLGDTGREEIPLLLCVAEETRPGRIQGLDETFLDEIQARVSKKRFREHATIVANGRVGGIVAIHHARDVIHHRGWSHCIVAGVDSFLVAGTLGAYQERYRLQTSQNSNGFIPGEAATAVLLGAASDDAGPQLQCLGLGFGEEKATVDSEEPLRADGMVAAFRAALADAQLDLGDLDFRIADVSGEQYGFKEAALALTRVLRKRKEEFDIWHPADCVGEVGAAMVPCVLGVALAASRKNYLIGKRAICHFANDDTQRAAMVIAYQNGETN